MKRARHPARNLVTRLHGLLFRRTNGRFGRSVRGMPVLVLETRGRKSGKPRSVPLLFVEDAGDWVVIASSGGDPRHPAWFLNLEAEPHGTVITAAGRRPVDATVTGGEERERLFGRLAEVYSGFHAYRDRTTRELPIVRLRPQG